MSDLKESIKTLRLKLRPECYNWLNKAAFEVNTVWNWAQETRLKALNRSEPKFLSAFDLIKLTKGATGKYDGRFEYLPMQSINCVVKEYVQKCIQFKKRKLRWRKSSGSKRSPGWIPFQSQSIRANGKYIKFAGKSFRVFEHEKLKWGQWRDGCFSQDSLGDWYLCIPIKYKHKVKVAPGEKVGIDLGLKDVATTSDGLKLPAIRAYRDLEEKIANAQRRGHKKQAKRLHRKAANIRKDTLHKISRKIVDGYQEINIGDLNSKFVISRNAKSALDNGIGMLKQMIKYKGEQSNRFVHIVNEAFTTQVCSNCGSKTGPKGLKQLDVREWTCVECETTHDRDINAAVNIMSILRSGRLTAVCGNDTNSPELFERSGDDVTACLFTPENTGVKKTTTERYKECSNLGSTAHENTDV